MGSQRTAFLFVSWLIAALVIVGAAMPASWQWQCRHGRRLVAAPVVVSPAAMPCRRAGNMGQMPCCRLNALAGFNPRVPSLRSAPCRPSFVPVASLPPAALTAVAATHSWAVTDNPPAGPHELILAAKEAPALYRQRPPPSGQAPSRLPLPLPGLRAPPPAVV